MKQTTTRIGPMHRSWKEECFTLARARRALPYLDRVLCDAVDAYNQAQTARFELVMSPSSQTRMLLGERRDAAIQRLNRTIDECHTVGVSMVDIAHGTVALRVTHRGVLMSVLWRIGEPIDRAWADLDRPDEAEVIHAARDGCTSPRNRTSLA